MINCRNADIFVLYFFSVLMNQNHVTTTPITYSKTSITLSHVTLPSKAPEMWWLRKLQVWHHLFGLFQWEFVWLWGYCLWCVVTSVDISGIYLQRKEGGSRRTEVNLLQWKIYSPENLPTYWCQGLTMIQCINHVSQVVFHIHIFKIFLLFCNITHWKSDTQGDIFSYSSLGLNTQWLWYDRDARLLKILRETVIFNLL